MFSFVCGNAQKISNTENEDFDALDQQTEYMNELVNNWYVKRSAQDEKDYTVNENLTDPLIISDSVYIKRLFDLPTVVSMSFNDNVKKWIEFYTKNTASRRYMLGISEYYMPFFEETFAKYDLPLELKYMSIIESALNPRAKSRSGAVGLWQFMYPTAKMYGLEINSYVDERMDVLKSTDAAARYLRDMYKIFGDWNLAIAAYNSGAGGVKKAILRSGGKTEYWEIYPYLPKETRGYIPAFIAALYSMNYYKEHYIVPKKVDMKMVTDTIMISKKLHLMQVSEYLKLDYEMLCDLNPQYKTGIIPGHYKSYPLRLPFENINAFLDAESEIYTFKDSVYLTDQVKIIEPSKDDRPYTSSNYDYTPPSEKGKKKLTYTIKSGDTYSNVAEWYDVSVNDLKYWNDTKSTKLQIGQKVEIWVPAEKYAQYSKIETMNTDQKNETNTVKNNSKPTQIVTPDPKKHVTYTIKQDDNLWSISKKFPGTTADGIKKINNFNDDDLRKLRVGQVIIIKNK
jgi:membrane-bound lytic murein transglycosylase D